MPPVPHSPDHRKLYDLGEAETIRRLLDTGVIAPTSQVIVPPGDDAAVLRPTPGMELVVTTDSFVEGVHYRTDLLPGNMIGGRLAAANLSDLAAMAASPRWAVISIGARREHDVEELIEVQRGFWAGLAIDGASIVGGNLAAVEGPEWWSVTLIGEVATGGAWTRAGARPGDLIAVSGMPGFAAAGLRLAAAHVSTEDMSTAERLMLAAWRRPRAEVVLARSLAVTGAVRAAIDVSDGLAGDLRNLCEASGLGATVEERELPNAAALAAVARRLDVEAEALALGPSDDYVLLMAIDPEGRAACSAAARSADRPLSFIGVFTSEPGLRVRSDDGTERDLRLAGFDHFAS